MNVPRELDEVVKEFLVESQDNLDRIDADLLALEQGSSAPGLLASIFRGIHTIKGTCGFLGLSQLEMVAHRGENLLSLLRDGTLTPTPSIVDALLQTVDAIRAILGRLEETGEEGNTDYSVLLGRLERLAAGQTEEEDVPTDGERQAPAAEPEEQGTDDTPAPVEAPAAPSQASATPPAAAATNSPPTPPSGAVPVSYTHLTLP
ncbi:MAG: Hpt domain-containing protein, partial [Nannocystaceae bacterium]|nr:Hpt domain-containing protein [Nannocystaceae bacterium]